MKIINKLRVGIDFDGILFDSIHTYLDLFNEYTGERYTVNDLTDWDLHKCLPQKYSKLIDNLWLDEELWHRVQPLCDSQQYVKRLVDNKYIDVFVVTDTHPDVIKIKVKLLHREYPFIDKNNIFICKNKQMVSVDILLDDAIHNLINGKYAKLLMTYPYNMNYNDSFNGIIRVQDWEQAYQEIITMLNARRRVNEILE